MKVAWTPSAMLFLACSIIALLHLSEAAPNCNHADIEAPAPLDCKYGIVRNWCHKRVCAKGPGKLCGGRYEELGKCGALMYCACNRCTGCYVTGECHSNSRCGH